MIDEILNNFPQEMIHEREEYLVKSLIDCAGFYYEFNLSKDLLLSEPMHMVNGEPQCLTEMTHKPLRTLTNFMMFWGARVFPEDKPAFMTMADTNYLLGLYLEGQEKVQHRFWLMDSFGKPMLAENNLLFYKDEESGDVFGIGYTKDLYEFDAAKQRQRDAQRVADTDVLTQCFNRRKLEAYAKEYLAQPDAKGAFIMIDLDAFKSVNDMMGHAYGDTLLLETASVIKAAFHDVEMVSRLGGDEFVVFVPDIDDKQQLQARLQTMLTNGHKVVTTLEDEELVISMSAGVALYPADAKDYEELYAKADEALYLSKRLGKNKYFYADEIANYADSDLPEIAKKVIEPEDIGETSDCLDILNSMYNISLYVMDESEHKILFYNKHLKEMCPHVKLGMVCSDMWAGRCSDCPLAMMNDQGFSRQIIYFEPRGMWMDVYATKILWKNKIPAYVVRAFPHTNQYKKGNEFYVD